MRRRFLPLGLVTLAACAQADNGALLVSGHIEATQVRLAAKVAGTIAKLLVREGDVVKDGQEIARIETTDAELGRRAAVAERDQAAAELRLREAGARKEDLAELAARMRATEADRTGAARDLERLQSLLDRGSGTAKSRDDARARADALAARLAAERQAWNRLRAGSRVEEIDAARARLAAAEARIALLDQHIRDAVIASPLDGIITARLAEPGEILAAGAPVVVVTDLAAAWLTAWIGEHDLGRIRLGQEALVRSDDGQERRGRVSFISSEAEFTPRNVQTREERVKLVFKIKIALDNADGLFKLGMPATASLATASRATATP